MPCAFTLTKEGANFLANMLPIRRRALEIMWSAGAQLPLFPREARIVGFG